MGRGHKSEKSVLVWIEQFQKNSSHEAATDLLVWFDPMLKMAAKKISRNRADLYEDLYQVARLALFRLIGQFDFSLGVQFQAYALKSIIGHLKNYLRDKSWHIQVPRRIKEKGLLLQKTVDELTVQLERAPKLEEIARVMQISVEETIEILAGREYYRMISLDCPVSQDEGSVPLRELIGYDEPAFQLLEKRIDLENAFSYLSDTEMKVIYLTYYEGRSQRDIARMLVVSQMSVSRIQQKAKAKLRKILQESG